MSIIVLNSKGSDPEDFSNYVTENIEFPKNAEVCLVSAHINRKLLIAQEVQFSSQGNRLAFQYGRGNLLARTVGNSYTPHSPYSYEFHEDNRIFPVKFTTLGEVEAAANAYLNNALYTPISPLVGGWACDVPASGLFTLHNFQRIPDPVQSEGTTTLTDIFAVPGSNFSTSGINSTVTPVGGVTTTSIKVFVPPIPQNSWIICKSNSDKVSNFIDTNPLFNTDNGATVGAFPMNPTQTSQVNGGWNWLFQTFNFATPESARATRGGIITSNGSIINPNKGDQNNGTNSVLNKLSNDTDFSVWWQIVDYNEANGSVTINFYKRPVLADGGKAYTSQMDGAIQWGAVRTTPWIALAPSNIVIGMRPVNDIAGGTGYCIEGYAYLVNIASNTIIGAVLPATAGVPAQPGIMKVTDPLDLTEAAADKCNLYRHLPLYQGLTIGGGFGPSAEVAMNAIHHGDHDGLMPAAGQTGALDYTFGFGSLTPQDQVVEKFDVLNWTQINRATIGYALGFNSSWLRQTAANMVPAPGPGAAAELPLGQTIPLAHCTVVSLPDLPISGFFGNSTGTVAAGTLGLNSGGTSAPIIGVIPWALDNAPTREAAPIPGINRDSRGTFYSSPMENWIQLKNPTSFKLSSLRVKLTDELGMKGNICAGNTTITIKIKAPKTQDIDRGLTRQGN